MGGLVEHYGVNPSAVTEAAPAGRIVSSRRERWLQNNREAIDAYNACIEPDGVISDGLRSF